MLASYMIMVQFPKLRNQHWWYSTVNYRLYLDFTSFITVSLFSFQGFNPGHCFTLPSFSLCFFFMTLTLLKSTDLVFCRMPFSLSLSDFFHNWGSGFGGRLQRWCAFLGASFQHDVGMSCYWWCYPWSPYFSIAKLLFLRF